MNNSYKTILINLDKDKDRLDYMTNQLKDLDIEFERFPAINGKEYLENGGDEYDEEKAIRELGLKLKPGEIGCALSHKRCYQKFLFDKEYENTKYLLIIEDDVLLNRNFKTILESEIRKNEEKYRWNFLQISRPDNSSFSKVVLKSFNDLVWNLKMLKRAVGISSKIKRIPYIFFAQIFTFILNFRYYILWNNNKAYSYILGRNEVCTGCYIVDKKSAKVLLSLTEKIFYTADGILYKYLPRFKNKDLNFYFYTPLIATQDNKFESTIDSLGKR
jgi:GR25 family glycosyltransferase involved in LPS biosynthesis